MALFLVNAMFCINQWIRRTWIIVADGLLRPHYGLRFASEFVLMAVYLHVLSCDQCHALGISVRAGALLVTFTVLWMGYSLLFGRKDRRTYLWTPGFIAGRCLLTVFVDAFLGYLVYVAVLRMMANGPEFFADDLTVPQGIEYSDTCECPDFRVYADRISTNGCPCLDLTPDFNHVYGAVNPGEPGRLMLLIYEVTTKKIIYDFYCCRPGEWLNEDRGVCAWSEDTHECFTFFGRCGIAFGRRNRPYAITVELWFRPDSGGRRRMLLSRNFIVHGEY